MNKKPTYEELKQKVLELEYQNNKLQKNEIFYKELMDLFPCPITITTMEHEFVNVNQEYVEITGFSKEDVIGKTREELNVFVYQDHWQTIKKAFANNKGVKNKVIKYRIKDGKPITVLATGKVFEMDEKPHIVSIGINITNEIEAIEELRESEEKFRLFAEASKDIIWQLDLEGRLTYISEAANSLLGYEINEILGNSYLALTTEEYYNKAIEAFDKAIKGRKFQITKFDILKMNGDILPMEISIIPIWKNEEIIGVQGLARDITDRLKTEQILKDNESILQELNATKDRFISIIAHDLKNPFNTILGFSKLLHEKYDTFDDIKRKNFINIINSNVINTFELLENLLLWSKSQSNKIGYDFESFNIKTLIQEVIFLHQQMAENKSINIKNNAENLDVLANKNTISTIIRNLINNAIKYTNTGGMVVIDTRPVFEQNIVLISVSDTGVGISDEKINDLFQIGKNTSTPGTENEMGAGLGLILCKEFIEKNNGEIWVESEENKGSTFFIKLRRATIPKLHQNAV